MRSDWSKIALYPAIITLRKAIIAQVLNFKMAASRFEVIDVIGEKFNSRECKDAIKFGVTLFERNNL